MKMKKVMSFLTVGLLSVAAFSHSMHLTSAEETQTADQKVESLFETYYADGVYVKETSINLSDDAVEESIKYFHAGSTVLNRTTYYAGDALWMSRGNGEYSYYGTEYDNEGNAIGVTNATATTPLVTPEKTPVVLSGEGKESMENYYVTMHDFKEASYVDKWVETDGIFSTTDSAIIDYFRQFTAPCILDTNDAAHYLQFTKATVEEVGASLVMSLYVDSTDTEGKLTNEDGLFSKAILTNDNKYVTKAGTVLASKATIETSEWWNVYRQANASETGWTATSVAKYGIAHGTFEEYEMFKKGSMGVSGTTIYPETWRVTFPKAETNAGGYYFLVVIEATDHCVAKFRDDVKVGGYFSGNAYIKKYTASSDSWTTISASEWCNEKDIAPFLSCAYQEMNAGDKLILGITNRATDASRNLSSGTFGPEIAEAITTTASDISDIKSIILDQQNTVSLTEEIRSLSKGNTNGYYSIGLLAGTQELPVVPCDANGWCGFTAGNDTDYMRVQFDTDEIPDSFYYTYTAKRSGYVYIDQTMLTWNPNVNSSVVATIDGEEVYNSGVRIHAADGLLNDTIAVYLHAGETLRVQVNHLSNPLRSVFQLRKINFTFVPSSIEYALPEGYTTLIDYLNA